MSDTEYRSRIGQFIAKYVNIEKPGYGYSDIPVIKSGINLLVSHGIFNKDNIRMALLKEQSVLVSAEFIQQCLSIGW